MQYAAMLNVVMLCKQMRYSNKNWSIATGQYCKDKSVSPFSLQDNNMSWRYLFLISHKKAHGKTSRETNACLTQQRAHVRLKYTLYKFMLVQVEFTHCLETPEVQLFTDLAFFKIIFNNKSICFVWDVSH